MITAVDTSAILSIFKAEADAEVWLRTLESASRQGPLVISEIVFAELAACFAVAAHLDVRLENLGIELLPSTRASLYRAGQIHAAYRRAGGPRATMVPDFLVGAHALVQAERLASRDRGYLRRHFEGLVLLTPESGSF